MDMVVRKNTVKFIDYLNHLADVGGKKAYTTYVKAKTGSKKLVHKLGDKLSRMGEES